MGTCLDHCKGFASGRSDRFGVMLFASEQWGLDLGAEEADRAFVDGEGDGEDGAFTFVAPEAEGAV
jgi:hypothetical protein